MNGVYRKEVLVKGRPTLIQCVDVAGTTLTISKGWPRIARVEDEWYEELADPVATEREIRSLAGVDADIFAFWNPIPERKPRYPLPFEAEELAVLPVRSFEDWWQNAIKSRTRNLIRKSEKNGLVVRETKFDDAFVRGMTAIFNEQSIRQGRPFWHYGKDEQVVRQQFSRFIHRETMIGAYVNDVMIGFVMLGWTERCAHLGQILSKVSERDRNPNNALMSKVIEVCARNGREHLIYGYWGDTSLAEFKRRCGFEPVLVPHYFVPLSKSGALAIRCGLHRGWIGLLPAGVKTRLRHLRTKAYALRTPNEASRG